MTNLKDITEESSNPRHCDEPGSGQHQESGLSGPYLDYTWIGKREAAEAEAAKGDIKTT